MENVEDAVPENEPTGMAPPSTDVLKIALACLNITPPTDLPTSGLSRLNVTPSTDLLTRAPVCPNVKPNVELTSDGPNASPSCTFTIEFRCRKRRKHIPTMDNKAITHSEFLTSTPQKIMLKEIRMKRLLAQRIKARNGKNPWKRKGKEIPKQKSRKIISLSKRKGKLVAVKLFPKVLQQTELASLNFVMIAVMT